MAFIAITGVSGFLLRDSINFGKILGMQNLSAENNIHYGNIVNAGIVAENANYIFSNGDGTKGYGIYRKDKNSNEIIKVCDDTSLYLNVFDDKVYFVNLSDSGKIYKMDLDGGNKEAVLDYQDCEYFSISKDGVFFEYPNDTKVYNPYVADTNFENVQKLNDDDMEGLNFSNGYLYY